MNWRVYSRHPTRLDILDIGDHFHRKHANILDDEFLIDNIQLFVALSRERPLVLDVGNDWVNIDVPLFEIDIVVRSFIIAPLELLDHLNAEHCHNGADHHLNTLLLLREQMWPILQHDKGDIDCVDGQRDQVGDDPPNGGWGICRAFFNRIGDQLTPILLEELE